MRELLEISRELRGLPELIGVLSEIEAVQGVLLGYHPFWTDLWHVSRAYGWEAAENYFRDRDRRWWLGASGRNAVLGMLDLDSPSLQDLQKLEWELRMKNREGGTRTPLFQVVVATEAGAELTEILERWGRGGDYPFSIRQSVRGRAYLCMPKRLHRPVVGGVSLGLGHLRDGTLGGLLRDSHGTLHGLTCAHVVRNASTGAVDQPAQCDNPGGHPHLGRVLHESPLTTSPGTGICNPYASGVHLHTVDAALVGIDPAIAATPHLLGLRPPSGIAGKAAVNPGDLMDVAGKESGLVRLMATKVALTFKYHDPNAGGHYCFTEAFELSWPSINGVLSGPPLRDGDSGAWLLNTAGQWAGMVIAADANHGYAMYADNAEAWARRALGERTPLTVT